MANKVNTPKKTGTKSGVTKSNIKTSKNKPKGSDLKISPEQRAKLERQVSREGMISRIMLGIVFIALAAFLIVSIYTVYAGKIGAGISVGVLGLFGFMGYILPFYFIVFSLLLFINRAGELGKMLTVIMIIVFFILASGTYSIHYIGSVDSVKFGLPWLKDAFSQGTMGLGGGLMGMTVAFILMKLIGVAGAYIATIASMLICLLLTLNKPFEWMLSKFRAFRKERKDTRDEIRRDIAERKGEMPATSQIKDSPEPEAKGRKEKKKSDRAEKTLPAEEISSDDKVSDVGAGGQAVQKGVEAPQAEGDSLEGKITVAERRRAEKRRDPKRWNKFSRYFDETQDDGAAERAKRRSRKDEEYSYYDEDAVSYGMGGNIDGIYSEMNGGSFRLKTDEKPKGLGQLGLDGDPFGQVSYGNPDFKDKYIDRGLENASEEVSEGRFYEESAKEGFFDNPYANPAAEGLEKIDISPSEGTKTTPGEVENLNKPIRSGKFLSEEGFEAAKKKMLSQKAESEPSKTLENAGLSAGGARGAGAAGIAAIRTAAGIKNGSKGENTKTTSTEVEKDGVIPYILPPISLLKGSGGIKTSSQSAELRERGALLESTLNSFNVSARVINVEKGPSVTRFEVQPDVGVKVSSIVRLQDDIALNLRAKSIRIEAPIPGKAAIGIEIENDKKTPVYLREVIESNEFASAKSKITFAVGRDISGNPVVANLKDMPHLLIAGSTGSGKSVCINSIIMSILYKAKPDEVKLIMVDPKVVELGNYNGIPHLMIPVVNQPSKAAAALNWAVREMEERYRKFSEAGVKDLAGYNSKAKRDESLEFMPQIVIIIDELADLMMAAPQQVEDAICRLAQMARAAGMHLIVATQRPSVDVITGVIKANMPSRIAFAVSSQIDSRTILDTSGAEKLLGKGDMLFNPLGMGKPLRVQGTFVTEEETRDVIEFVSKQYGHEAEFHADLLDTMQTNEMPMDGGDTDDLLPDAIELVINMEQASASMLQRKFRVGYNRAARMVDMMEERGIVAPADGSRPRKVLISKEAFEAMKSGSTLTDSAVNSPADDDYDDDVTEDSQVQNPEGAEPASDASGDSGETNYVDDGNMDVSPDYEPDPDYE